MNEVLKIIKERRSIRSFKSEQITQEELDGIIEAGIYAPTGHNTQPWHFTIIQNREVCQHINDTAKKVMATIEVDWIKKAAQNPEYDVTFKAPTLIIVSGKKDAVSWRTDCDAAIENMLIAAESLNIGSLWLGFAALAFKIEGESEKIGIPDGYEAHYGISLGYKAQDKQPTAPKRNYNVVNYIR